VLAGLGVAIWASAITHEATRCTRSLSRVIYSLSACAIISMATLHARAPSFVRFVSEATLTIYLYHHIAHKLMMPHLAHWPAVLRILVQAAVALGASAALAWLGQRLLGKRSHLLLGS
jgi:fucose 4-O-acetylase-like acetyltransferase